MRSTAQQTSKLLCQVLYRKASKSLLQNNCKKSLKSWWAHMEPSVASDGMILKAMTCTCNSFSNKLLHLELFS